MLRRFGLQKLLYALIIVSMSMALLPFSTCFAAPEPIGSATCTLDGLAVFKGPGTGYDMIGTLHSGDVITLLQEKNGWYRFDFSGKNGWSNGRYLSLSGTPATPMQNSIGTAVCNAANMQVRSGPGTSYQAIGIVPKDQLLNLYAQCGDWFQIGYGTNTGFVSASYLKDIRMLLPGSTSPGSPLTAVSNKPAATPDTSTVIGTATANLSEGLINVRTGPGSGCNRLGTMEDKTSYDVYAEQGDWLCIQFGEQKGWITKTHVVFSRPTDPTASPDEQVASASVNSEEEIDDRTPIGEGMVNTMGGPLSVHKGPGEQYKVTGHIAMAETVDIMSISGNWYYISFDGKFGYVDKAFLRLIHAEEQAAPAKSVNPLVNQVKGTVELINWFGPDGIRASWTKGTSFIMIDVRTGTVMHMKYWCGTNHADIEPLTKADTSALKKCYGGHWTWNRRPVWVIINGHTYAGSINGMPHGGDTLPKNGMSGQICLHFVGSETHCTGLVDQDHQAAIQEAYLAGK